MLGFITATLSNSGTRYIARSLGEDNEETTKEIFLSILYVTKNCLVLRNWTGNSWNCFHKFF